MPAPPPLEPLIRAVPKAELHLHIEGTLEPELMFELAARNGVQQKVRTVEEARRARTFHDLQSFLDVYYDAMQVLLRERDFYDLTRSYLESVAAQNVRHVEMFFDPQAHTGRGVPFEAVVTGIHAALEEAGPPLRISSRLIMCFLRHLSADAAMRTLEEALPFAEWIVAVGLDSSEKDHPPRDFVQVFDRARAAGWRTVAHAGEEGPAGYITEALDLLKVSRIDHGVRCVEDPRLVERLVREQIPLTVCPLSNVRLRVFDRLERHNLKTLLDRGLRVTVNSDDPAYFGGYVLENLLETQQALGLTARDIVQLERNAFEASFLDPADARRLVAELARVSASHGA